MIEGVIFFLTSLSIFIIFAEKLDAKVNFEDGWKVEIHSTVIALELIFNDSGNAKKRNSKKRKSDFQRFLFKLFSRSSATIDRLEYTYRPSLPHTDVIRRCAYCAIASALVTYLGSLFKKFKHSNIIIHRSEHNNSRLILNAKLEITLYSFLTCLISYWFCEISAAIKKKVTTS